jgi:beta-lactamase superfamily II metal-dependent hydrolase
MNKIENIIAVAIVAIFVSIGSFLIGTDNHALPENGGDNLEIHFLNVGQGDAILFEKGDNQTLLDGGPDRTVLTRLSEVMPIGDKTIETVILTHPHADHLRGLNYVLESYQVDRVFFNGIKHTTPEYYKFWSLVTDKRIPTEILYRGKNTLIGELTLITLSPVKGLANVSNINDTSLIILAVYGDSRILLTGDASATVQEKILADIPRVDILKLSHHGSKTGVSKPIIDYIKPKYVTITVGNNSYGHPSVTALSIINNSIIYRTDRDGTISFWSDKSGVFLY